MAARSRKPDGRQKRQSMVPARGLGRRTPTRAVNKSILIVCEDGKSSPGYFKRLRHKLGLSSVHVEVCGKECGSAPLSVVDFAKEKKESVKTSTVIDEYDEIFCVIDKDQHETLDRAYNKARDNDLTIILSNPCFEYWYVLHFERTGRSYTHHRNVVTYLKRECYDKYDKGSDSIFDVVYGDTDTAIANSKHVLRSQWHDPDDLRECNPSTHVHVVIECIRGIGKV